MYKTLLKYGCPLDLAKKHDFITLISGGSTHPPIVIMLLTLIPVIGLYYVSQKGELKS
jgi:hypothetical protein